MGRTRRAARLEAARADPSSGRLSFETFALAGWAHVEPQKAWEATLALSANGADRRYPVPAVLYAIASVDLGRALLYFEELPPDRACMECNAGNLCMVALQQDKIPQIHSAIERLPVGPARAALRDRLWELLGNVYEDGALTQLSQLPAGADRDAALIKIYMGWATANTRAALDAVLKRSGASNFEALLLAVLQVWAGSARAQEIPDTLAKLPVDLTERSVVGIVSTLVRTDPERITAWAASFTHESLRGDALNDAMYTWSRLDPEAALKFIHRTPDLETKGILVWAYTLGRVWNRTLTVADLQEINAGFNKDWVVRLLKKIASDLGNPSSNDVQFFDVKAFIQFVNTQSQLDDKDRAKILSAVKGS